MKAKISQVRAPLRRLTAMIACELEIGTSSRTQALDITERVESTVRRNGVNDGICIVCVPHTTAGIMINEGADPAVVEDILAKLEELVPWGDPYRHAEGNSAAHIKSSLLGHSVTLAIKNGKLRLGTWQAIFFCEFDGPRRRRLQISIIKG